MSKQRERRFIRWAVALFGCDTARVTVPCGKLFLIAGWNRRSEGEWLVNGTPHTFDYVEEKCLASGANWRELRKSCREYKRLEGMTMMEYLTEQAQSLAERGRK